jgi:GTP cyclohydrolase I
MRDDLGAARAIEAFLVALGHDPEKHPALSGTGARVATLFADDLLDGYLVDPAVLLADSIPAAEGAPLVAIHRLATHVVCPHHLTIGAGHAAIVYQPTDRLVGLGVLADLVDACAHRLTLQEDAGREVARALCDHLGARGAGCMLTLRHGCLEHQGKKKRGAVVRTVSLAGSFDEAGKDRDLALAALFRGGPNRTGRMLRRHGRGTP